MARTTFIHRSAAWVVASAALFAGSMAMAEPEASHSGYEFTSPTAFHQPVSPYPVELGFTQHHSSTAIEGAQRGRAAVIQAWGNFQLSQSQAQILRQQARALDRENDLKQTQALLAQQTMWREGREEVRKHEESRAAEGKAKLTARRSTVYRQAYRLSPAELNMATGEIRWPAALQTAKYQQDRVRMQELFRQHVAYGEPQPGTAEQIARCSDELARMLRTDIRTLPQNEYVSAQKFLLGLKFEASALTEAT